MDRIYLNELFDYYNVLLTKKEQDIFIDHYEDDLSLQEIADNLNISKSAVGKTLKIVEKKLIEYEQKLELNKKNTEINRILKGNVSQKILDSINELI
ncbi:MAG TPA: helix-turn-helix domain-containing protein [Bacilli bacterium]|jgi:UPF0122 protein CLL_A1244|nr:helix-turn-helix domain-containing protein [Bacilli bacterium]